ncbi:MAG TPA: DNA-binding domain-containing protein [Polyangia bacterium]|nr:DNA-binding domain-containing protein [Polyangia bacterium]
MRPDTDELARLQRDLFARITGLPVGRGHQAVELVVGDARATAEERLQVYATMYRLRVAEALESQFPRVARALGPEAFAETAVAFVADVPSRDPSLRWIGRGFPDWLAARRTDEPELIELARLEWARADVFDLADQAVLTVDRLRGLPPESFAQLPLRLIDAHRFVAAGDAALALWASLREDGQSEADPGPPTASGGGALVWRQDVAVYHRGLAADEREALEPLVEGTTFGLVCERLAVGRTDEEAATRAFGWLSTWALDGLLADPGKP